MKALYSQEDFDRAKSRDLLPLECKQCHHMFYNEKRKIREQLKGGNHHYGIFCSNECKNASLFTSISTTCNHCGKIFNKVLSAFHATKHHFCCKSHAAKYHNAHKKGGTRVSKLERWLQAELPLQFPNLEFHFNRVDAIKAELDIYVPSLKLAFELNGIFHYEPIFGPEKLATMKNNDQRKMQACLESGIELCILDVSRETYFKPSKAQKYLEIILRIIQAKRS